MKLYTSILFFIILNLTISCFSLKEQLDKNKSTNVFVNLEFPPKDSLFTYFVGFNKDIGRKLIIETELINDSILLNQNYFRNGNKVIVSQKLIFNDKKIFDFSEKSPFNIKQEVTVNGVKIMIPKYVYTELSTIEREGTIIYILYAWGLSNGSKEISSYFNEEGELLYESVCGNNDCDSTGSFSQIPPYFDLNPNSTLESWRIFPPKFAGVKVEY